MTQIHTDRSARCGRRRGGSWKVSRQRGVGYNTRMDEKRPKSNVAVSILLFMLVCAAMLYASGFFAGKMLMGPEMEAVLLIAGGLFVACCSIGMSVMCFGYMRRGCRNGEYRLSGRAISRAEKPIEFVATGVSFGIYGIIFLFLAPMGVMFIADVL